LSAVGGYQLPLRAFAFQVDIYLLSLLSDCNAHGRTNLDCRTTCPAQVNVRGLCTPLAWDRAARRRGRLNSSFEDAEF